MVIRRDVTLANPCSFFDPIVAGFHDLNKVMGWKAWETRKHPRYNRTDYSPSGWQLYEGNYHALTKAGVAEMAGKVLGGEWSYDRPLGGTCWRFYRVR